MGPNRKNAVRDKRAITNPIRHPPSTKPCPNKSAKGTKRRPPPSSSSSATSDSEDSHPSQPSSSFPPVNRASKLDAKYQLDQTLRPTEFKCPFSDPSRADPCTTLKDGIKKKTQITNHLLAVQNRGGDSRHPKDDPLWNERIITNYYLCKRPIYELDERAKAQQEYNKRAYQKRKDRETAMIETAEAQYKSGEMTAEEYRRILVGNRRIRFDQERDVQSKVQAQLNARIEQLRLEIQPTEDSRAQLAQLEASQRQCEELNTRADGFKDQLLSSLRRLIEWFGDSDTERPSFLDSGEGLFNYAGLSFPTDDKPATFYFWAAFITAKKLWPTFTPWKDDSMRHLRVQVKALVTKWEKEDGLTDESKSEVKMRLQVFNSALDKVRAARDETSVYNELDAEVWQEEQNGIWREQQQYVGAVFEKFNGDDWGPVDIIETVDQYSQLLKHMDGAIQEAARVATNALSKGIS